MTPSTLKIFYEPKDRLRLTIGDECSYPTVKPAWAAPLSRPNTYLALLDGKGDEIVTVADPAELPKASREAVEEELRRRYLTATVLTVQNAKQEFGATYWTVISDRGPRDFVTQSLQENAIWIGPNHLLLVDVDGNRFEIPDITKLDQGSQNYIDSIL
jgi:hypothetical protein